MKLSVVRERVRALHTDDRGEIPIGPILIIGLIVVPLVLVLYAFRDELTSWFEKKTKDVLSKT